MSIFGQIVPSTKLALKRLLNDPYIQELVTYKKWISTSFDDSKGYNVAVYEDTEDLKTLRLRHNSRSAAAANASVQVGDEVFIFLSDDFPSGASLKDLIVDSNGVTMKVSTINDIYDIAYSIDVESGGVQ